MPKRSNAFQALVAQIQHHFGRDAGYVVEESRFLQHADTGEDREVDIVVEGSMVNVPLVISFECTSGGRKAGSPWVEAMIGKHRRLPTHRLILVSESGFTKPALVAVDAEKDVEAVTFAEASDVDWAAYADHFEQLRFGGFEAKPIRMQAHWQGPPEVAEKKSSLDPPTLFRKVDSGQELDARALALDILSNREVGKLVMERYFSDQRTKEAREAAGPGPIGYEGQIEVNMKTQLGTWEVRFEEGAYPLTSVDVTAKLYIRDTPMTLSYKSFMGTRVAHATVQKPFANVEKDKGDELVFVITQADENEPVVSISFTDADPESKSVHFASMIKGSGPAETP